MAAAQDAVYQGGAGLAVLDPVMRSNFVALSTQTAHIPYEGKRVEMAKEIAKKAEAHEHKEGEAHSEEAAGEEEGHNEVHFKAIEVIPGTTDLGYTEVKFVEAIPADAKIVIKGAFYLLSAMKGGGEHGH